jgi:hypothetical protein
VLQAGALRAIEVAEYPYDPEGQRPPDRNPRSANMTVFDLVRLFHPGKAESARSLDDVLDAVMRTTDAGRLERRRAWVDAELRENDFAGEADWFTREVTRLSPGAVARWAK